MFAKLMSTYPASGKELAAYRIDGISVNVFDVPETIQPLYHVTPPEFKLSEEKYAKGVGLIYRAMKILDTQCIIDCQFLEWEDKAEKGYILTQQIIDYN